MFAVFIVRGPWGYLQRDRPESEQADARITTLDGLLDVLPPLPAVPARAPAVADRQTSPPRSG